jgi:PAS domain S-box-containing protein
MEYNTSDDPRRLGSRPPTNEMVGLIGSHDWSATAVGASESWSPALRLIVSIMCASGFPMAVRWGPDFTLIYNDGYKPILADKHPWALGRPFREAWPEVQAELLPLHEDILCGKSAAVFSEDRPLTIQRRGQTWETAHFTVCYSPIPDETSPTGVGGVLVTAVETTDRKRAEDALRELNRTLEAQVAARARERDEIWRVSKDMLLVVDRQGIYRAVNPAWTRTLGYTAEELIGNRLDAFIESDDVGPTYAAIERAGREALPGFENRHRHKDGSWRHVSWTAAPSGEFIYCVARDITEEKLRERAFAETQAHLRQAQKMEAIGQLTGGVAHDFNNLLTVIRSSADLLRRRELPPDRMRRYVDAISDTADRAAKLTGQLLTFARRHALNRHVFDAADQLVRVADMLRTVLGSRISFELDIAEHPLPVEADANQFETALVNLVANARDAMDGKGSLTIRVTKSREAVLDGSGSAANEFVAVSVSDTGCGIPADRLDRIFEPFFTTKDVGRGTGLGLSQVYGFAQQSGGMVRVGSEVGAGTTITLQLPLSSRPIQPRQGSAYTSGDSQERWSILVVEDNPEVGEFSTQLLKDLGYQTVLARNAEEALKLLDEGPERFDIVLSDVVMPGLDGVSLGREIRRRLPGLPFVLNSGYSHILADDESHGFDLLHKPYSVEELSKVLRRAVANRDSRATGN